MAKVTRWYPTTKWPTARALLDSWERPEHDHLRSRAYFACLHAGFKLGVVIA